MSVWGDFRRDQDRGPHRAPPEGPTGWVVALGLLLFIFGIAGALTALATYSDLRADDARGDRHLELALAPGIALALVGLGVFVWGWWRQAHTD